MNRRSLSRSAGGLALAVAGIATARADEPRVHKIAIHVGSADPVAMATALHNIAAASDHYAGIGEKLAIELVANGQGYAMLRADTSPVQAILAETHAKYPAVVFAACQISRKAAAVAERRAPQDIPQVPWATDTPSGIVRLNELQEQDFSYIRA